MVEALRFVLRRLVRRRRGLTNTVRMGTPGGSSSDVLLQYSGLFVETIPHLQSYLVSTTTRLRKDSNTKLMLSRRL